MRLITSMFKNYPWRPSCDNWIRENNVSILDERRPQSKYLSSKKKYLQKKFQPCINVASLSASRSTLIQEISFSEV